MKQEVLIEAYLNTYYMVDELDIPIIIGDITMK